MKTKLLLWFFFSLTAKQVLIFNFNTLHDCELDRGIISHTADTTICQYQR